MTKSFQSINLTILSHLCAPLTKLFVEFQSENFYCDLKLVIVDSVTSVISPILGGQQTDGMHCHLNFVLNLLFYVGYHSTGRRSSSRAILRRNKKAEGLMAQLSAG